jgi:hypothetical protein
MFNVVDMTDEEIELVTYALSAIEECLNGNFENSGFIFDPVSMKPCHPFIEFLFSQYNISEKTQKEWMEEAQEVAKKNDTDFSMIHPDETVEDFWEHEDLDD